MPSSSSSTLEQQLGNGIATIFFCLVDRNERVIQNLPYPDSESFLKEPVLSSKLSMVFDPNCDIQICVEVGTAQLNDIVLASWQYSR